MSTLLPTDQDELIFNQTEEPVDEVELAIQQIFSSLENMPAESQGRFCSRLLSAIAERLTPSIAEKAIISAKTSALSSNQKQSGKKSSAKSPKKDFRTHLVSQLDVLQDRNDPIEAWHHFGSPEKLLEALREEPEGSLERILQHSRMPGGLRPRGKSSEALAKNIVARLQSYFQ